MQSSGKSLLLKLTRSFAGSRKAARILLTMDENDPRRLFEGKNLFDIAEVGGLYLLSLSIFNMIITLISFQVRHSSEEW